MRKIGARLCRIRRLQRLTQEDLAQLSGYSPGYIGSVENARKVPSMEFLFNVASALGSTPSELLIDAGSGLDREGTKDRIKGLLDQL